MDTSVGFIGLGNMGSAMASNLLKHNVKLFVYNRSKDKATALIEKGAGLVNSPRELFEKTSIVFSMVANDEALEDIVTSKNGILETAKKNSIHVSMSTVSIQIIQKMRSFHEEKGVHFLSAPVFGRPEAAMAQKLWICLAGNKIAKERVLPFLQCMGQKVSDFGEIPESANVVKVSGNFLILSLIESMSEAFAFAAKNGIDLSKCQEFFQDSLFSCPVFKTYGELLVTQKFNPAGFKMDLGLKDINMLLKAAEQSRVPMPIAGLLHDRLLEGLARNRKDLDWSAISLSSFENAGIQNLKESDEK